MITTPYLLLEQITLAYPGRPVLANFSLQLERGHLGALLGASGCGKSTVLRAISGFEPVHAGRITLEGRLLAGDGRNVPPEERQIGMMFQDYALFPHLSLANNIGFGLRRLPRVQQQRRIAQMLELVGLTGLGPAFPHEISGGQQQRVALARALAPEPSLLLLDEPFSNLDTLTRERLAFDVRDILKDSGATALLVTHNQAEAYAMADRMGIMIGGTLRQWGSPRELSNQPVDDAVAEFLGLQDNLASQRAAARQRAS
ncbi:ABC transporter ATP-binding protein [Kerstersia gyiorum]|jgi:iron(III) transport system ATP-binding protein|uniref:ABC transporter ATP-binding protein n=1 Tax=Kerstersia gyiorum TaxID=206506 RepID=UPI002431CC93|nr:ABC transporter ATP-binding protein [Kerstersia gyiorum]MCH4272005.1 ABC transporter ATP-binding protein [Kerstersia gyiorum]MCI1228994.1 ABC transporter ATP-binding protein [Kerstersia gyiorum]